jgi:putative spermidine/putrescine transport system permease protein
MTIILALCVAPVLRVLSLSFTEPRPGLENYAHIVDSEALHHIAVTTISVSLATTVITVALGYVVAYAMVRLPAREVRAMFFLILLTFWLSILARTFAWIILLRGEGPVNEALMALGVIASPLTLVRNTFGVILGMVHVMLPIAILPLYASLRGIDQRLTAAARGLGCGPLRSFLWVFLPLSAPGIFAASCLVFVFSLGFFITPAIMGGGRVIMIAEYIQTQFEQTLRWGYAAMLAVLLLVCVFATLGLATRVVGARGLLGGAR